MIIRNTNLLYYSGCSHATLIWNKNRFRFNKVFVANLVVIIATRFYLFLSGCYYMRYWSKLSHLFLQKEELSDGPHHEYQKSSEINQSSSLALSSKIITTQLKPSASSKYSCCQLAQQEQWRDKKLKSILL